MPTPLRTARRALVALVTGSLAGCAVVNPQRRHTLNYLDAHAAPSGLEARWLVSPAALPVGVAALVTDAVVVHPATQIDDACRDTADFLWDYDHDSPLRAVLLTPLSALATPPVFCVDWLLRSAFDVDDNRREAGEDSGSSREVER